MIQNVAGELLCGGDSILFTILDFERSEPVIQ